MEEKIQPQDLDSEQAVLGSMMMSKEAIALVVGKLRPEYFYRPAHTHIFRAIVDLYKKNEPIDLLTVTNALKKNEALESAGGRAYLAEVIDSVPTAANAVKYSEIVFEKALLRRLIDSGSSIISHSFDATQEVGDVLDFAQKSINEISRLGVSADFVHLKEVLNNVFDDIQSTYDTEDKILGVPTGFSDLDLMTSGFQSGDLVILAAKIGRAHV